VEVPLHAFVTMALNEGNWSAGHLSTLLPGEVLPLPIADVAGWDLEQTWTLWGLYPFQE